MSNTPGLIQAGPAQQNHGYYTIRASPGKGNGAFALKNIRAGTKILVDTALFIVPCENNNPTDDDIRRGYAGLDPADRTVYDSLPIFRRPDRLDLDVLFKFECNMFTSPTVGTGCFAHASRFNHSCRPNCSLRPNQQFQMECIVHRDVLAGEELTFCYEEKLLYCTTAGRRRAMPFYLNQPCECEVCANTDPEERQASDLRRHMIRWLSVFISGLDPIGGKLIIDDTLRNDLHALQQEHDLHPDWARLLLICLAEREGIIGIADLGIQYATLIAMVLMDIEQVGWPQVDQRRRRDVGKWLARADQFRWLFRAISNPQVAQVLETSCQVVSEMLATLRWEELMLGTEVEVEGMD